MEEIETPVCGSCDVEAVTKCRKCEALLCIKHQEENPYRPSQSICKECLKK